MRKLILFVFLISATLWAEEPVLAPTSRTLQGVNPIRKIFNQISQVNEERALLGLDPVINLSIGQPHIGMQPYVLNPFIAYLEDLKSLSSRDLSLEMGYDHASGKAETRKWISRFYSETFPEVAGGFAPEEVMVTNGATGALSNVLKVLIDEGDEVAVFAPYFSSYKTQVVGCRGALNTIPLVLGVSPAQALDQYLSSNPRIKAIIWNDPSNPLGNKSDKRELKKIASVLRKYPNLAIIHDEVYRDTVHDGKPLSLINVAPDLKVRSFIIRSLAKDILGAPGIRAGMLSGPVNAMTPSKKRVNFVDLMSNEQGRECACVSVLVQKMLCIALEQKLMGSTASWEQSMQQEYAKSMQLLINALAEIGLQSLQNPKGAFFAVIDASSLIGKKVPSDIGPVKNLNQKVGSVIQTDIDLAMFFLHAVGVAVVPGSGFEAGVPSFRISCAKSEAELLEAAHRVKLAIEALQ